MKIKGGWPPLFHLIKAIRRRGVRIHPFFIHTHTLKRTWFLPSFLLLLPGASSSLAYCHGTERNGTEQIYIFTYPYRATRTNTSSTHRPSVRLEINPNAAETRRKQTGSLFICRSQAPARALLLPCVRPAKLPCVAPLRNSCRVESVELLFYSSCSFFRCWFPRPVLRASLLNIVANVPNGSGGPRRAGFWGSAFWEVMRWWLEEEEKNGASRTVKHAPRYPRVVLITATVVQINQYIINEFLYHLGVGRKMGLHAGRRWNRQPTEGGARQRDSMLIIL